ncbi:MAG TPA: D-glycero-beta-D-manno-heptose 1-phosphate adenylyltransferase, partial [Candidatus Lambdaproteobacteria bacterium]|nr:D-glycero-beta-D-manno-heptose 1-phosphate adenylyltransferase [Candidatus Lambdaproteobacteria bacterium]
MKQVASKTGFTDYKIRPFETIAEQVRKWREEDRSLVF